MSLALPRPRLSSRTYCLVVVCLLHGFLLFTVLKAGGAPVSGTTPKPEPVTIALIPPAPPAISAPVAEPEPQPIQAEAKPVSKPVPSPAERAPLPPSEATPDSFIAPPVATPPPSAASEMANNENAVISEPIFDADYLRNPAPIYPKLSRQRKEEGVVLLRVHVLATGEADQLEVLQSSGFERLDDAALRAVKRWQFVPAKRGDEIIAAWVRVPVRFNLNS